MEIPLWIILVPLGVIVALAALFLFFNVFHLARYGVVGRGATALIAVYVISFACILFLGAGVLADVDWTETAPLSAIVPFTGKSSSSFGL